MSIYEGFTWVWSWFYSFVLLCSCSIWIPSKIMSKTTKKNSQPHHSTTTITLIKSDASLLITSTSNKTHFHLNRMIWWMDGWLDGTVIDLLRISFISIAYHFSYFFWVGSQKNSTCLAFFIIIYMIFFHLNYYCKSCGIKKFSLNFRLKCQSHQVKKKIFSFVEMICFSCLFFSLCKPHDEIQ